MKVTLKKLKIFWAASAIIALSLTLNFLLNMSSFEDVYKSTLISKYKQINRNLNTKLEAAVSYGKPLYKFSGIDDLINEIISKEEDVTNVFVTLKSGQVLYSFDKTYIEKHVLNEIIPGEKELNSEEKVSVFKIENNYFLASPIYYENSEIKGFLYIEFNTKVITDKVMVVIKESINFVAVVLIISMCLLLALIMLLDMKSNRKNFIVIMAIITVSQFSYSYINIQHFENRYLLLLNQNVSNFAENIEDEIVYFNNLGLPIQRLKGFEKYLAKEIQEVPGCLEVYVTDKNNNELFYADASGDNRSRYQNKRGEVFYDKNQAKYYQTLRVDLAGQDSGNIILRLNDSLINKKITEQILDAVTIFVISLIISYKILLLVSIQRKQTLDGSEEGKTSPTLDGSEQEKNTPKKDTNVVIQLLAFIFYFGEMLPISFIPLLAADMYKTESLSFLGMSESMIIGLPITTYMLGAAIFVLVIGFFAGKISEKKIFVGCSLFLVIGAFGAAFSNDIGLLSFFRFISGLGYGGISINATSLILRIFKKNGNVATGFGYWASGYGAAAICALPIGGILVYRFGFFYALGVSGIISVILMLFAIFFIHFQQTEKTEPRIEPKTEKTKLHLNIFNDRNVFANFFFRLVPFHLVFIGIFQFIMPLTMNKEGISEANIGRILTIFGLVYLLMPFVSKLVNKVKNDRMFIAFGSMLIGVVLLTLKFSDNIVAFIFVVAGISLGSMIADAAEESFITSTKKAKEIGEVKFMSIYNSYERLIMVFAPLLCSFAVTQIGFSDSIFVIGLFTMASSVAYLFISKKNPQ
ncbi:transporter major facilitator superfamily MFS_1 [Psychromonas ingrahamii 37]|uniref:Transporter major facilitator superfamily MFS_1 n=1 Tax=Psychromonas ingrahamii (strain DSM 17664 / CCUG 51855 / 37) TaxID=357804 RepID=A1SQZ5_PSYIN|nr:MFS transporter [Psychromonas ingrahamii]ABM01910.1 transporter major facilitator superfamily MFS_1 [Psychromonas ingrahamii 37]